MSVSLISEIKALEVLDSRGNPTIEARVRLSTGETGSAMVPSGASTGSHEAHELRDGDKKRYGGKGVLKAIENVEKKIAPALKDMDIYAQKDIDWKMIDVDGTENKSEIGANAMLAVSMACAKAGVEASMKPLYLYLKDLYWGNEKRSKWQLPVPMMNVMNGGKHAVGSVDLQEFMIVPYGAPSFKEAVRWGAEVYHTLKKILHEKDLPVGVGDEGGFMPKMKSHKQVLEILSKAIEKAGYKLGSDFGFALDPAATEVFEDGVYNLTTEGKKLINQEMVELYHSWASEFPIVSIEDGLAEDDWDGFKLMTTKMGSKMQIVGDDLFVTNAKRLQRGIDTETANSILVKVNQIGTLTEAAEVIAQATSGGFTAIVSHRSGETEDAFIADLVVASGAGQIKTGAPCRSDRVAKYNQLLRLESYLGDKAEYAKFPFMPA